METVEVNEIYIRYGIPSNLKEHMLRATAISSLICDEWQYPNINKNRIITVMLLHDMGNIVKIDVSNTEFLPNENKNQDYWIRMKEKYIEKYGTEDHIITFNILSELGLERDKLWLVINKIFINNEMIGVSTNYELKICAYSDQISGPFGVLSLQERFEELRKRYGSNPNASINHPRIEFLISSAFKIEEQINKQTKIDIHDLDEKRISKKMKELLNYEIQINSVDWGVL